MFQLFPVLLRIATFMVDAGYGKAVIPILLKAKELYVSFKHNIPFFRLFFPCSQIVYNFYSLQDTLEDKTTSDLQTVHLYCNINYSLACLYVDLDMLDQAEPVHKDVLHMRER